MEKKSTKSFKEYTQRQWEQTTQVKLPLTDLELATIFINTLKSHYYEFLIGNATNILTTYFQELFSFSNSHDIKAILEMTGSYLIVDMNQYLTKKFTIEDVFDAFNQMQLTKALGLYVIPLFFFWFLKDTCI